MGESATSNEQIVSQAPFILAPGVEPVRRGGVDSLVTVVARGATFKGEIRSEGEVAIFGTFEGGIESATRIQIHHGAEVRGDLRAPVVLVAGELHGEISAHRSLTVHSTASIIGDIQTVELVVEPGAAIQGRCTMPTNSEDLSPES